MITVGGLQLVPFPGIDLIVEIREDDWPSRFPWLGEPKAVGITGRLDGEDAYGQFEWIGLPLVDGRVSIEVTNAGNRAPRFRWTIDDEETWTSGVLVDSSVPLGDTGLSASFPLGTYVTGTKYTFDGPGAAERDGPGPEVTITGAGSAEGIIEIQTGIGSVRHRVGAGAWSAPIPMAALHVTIAGLGVQLRLPEDDSLGLEILDGARFDFRVRGRFTLVLSGGGIVETYERLRVDDPLWFAAPGVPASRRSKLVSTASWVSEVRPPVG